MHGISSHKTKLLIVFPSHRALQITSQPNMLRVESRIPGLSLQLEVLQQPRK